VFFKSKPDIITPENLHSEILVSSMLDSPVSALYHSLHKVYSPILLKDSTWSHEFDPKLQVKLILIFHLLKYFIAVYRSHNRWVDVLKI
jgi:hypothetical protein